MKICCNSKNLPLAALAFGGVALGLRRALYTFAVDALGLMVPGHPLAWMLGLTTALAAAFILWQSRKGRDASVRISPLATAAGCFFCAAAVAITVTVIPPMTPGYPAMAWVVLGYAAAVALAVKGYAYAAGKTPGYVPDLSVCLFCVLHIIDHYKTWSGDPQLMNCLFSLLSMGCLSLFALYGASARVGLPRRKLWLATGLGALFSCAADLSGGYFLMNLGFIAWVCVTLWASPKGEKTNDGAA